MLLLSRLGWVLLDRPVFARFGASQSLPDLSVAHEPLQRCAGPTALGWTRRLARDTKTQLVPEIIRTVVLAWYYCAQAAEKKKAKAKA